MTEERSRRLAAVMFTDVVGYTAMMQDDEEAARVVRLLHREALEAAIAAHGGELVQYLGDGSLSTFPSTVRAVSAAVEIQRALREDVPLRIGVHQGEIAFDGQGIYGDSVNVASRVMGLGIAGSVVISDKAQAELENQPGFSTASLGQFPLKNVRRPPIVYAVEADGIAVPTRDDLLPFTESTPVYKGVTQHWPKIALAAAGIAAFVTTALVTGIGRSGGVATAALIDPNSIVVLPFRNMSSDPEQEYMSDGIAEDLLNLLAQIPELTVISRTSAFSFKGRDDLTIPQIAAELGVAHVLEGSVQRAGNTIRITAQLIDAQSDAHLFSEQYTRTLDDIFAVQDEIARRVVSELRVTLLGELPTLQETDPEAYALFLQARYVKNTGDLSQENHATTITMFERVREIAPDYAPTYGELAAMYGGGVAKGFRPPEEGLKAARDAAERGLALDPDLVYARTMLGWVSSLQGDFEGAARHLEQAMEMEPTHPDVLMNVGHLLLALDRFDEAIPFYEYVRDRDPVYLVNLLNLAMNYNIVGRWEDAAATSRTILDLTPIHDDASTMLGLALLQMGELDEALAAAESVTSPPNRLSLVAMANYGFGRQLEFERAFQELRDDWGEALPIQVASVYAYAGDVDATFEWLDRVTPAQGLITLATFLPAFDDLRDDPRWPFTEIILGLSEERRAISFEVRLPR
jgi:TolB-like protein/class 3 adenylate cyclase